MLPDLPCPALPCPPSLSLIMVPAGSWQGSRRQQQEEEVCSMPGGSSLLEGGGQELQEDLLAEVMDRPPIYFYSDLLCL